MSKTIEALKRVPIKSDVLYEHIADTYFYQRSRQKNLKKKIRAAAKNFRMKFFKIAALGAAIFLSIGFIFFLRAQTPQAIRKSFSKFDTAKFLDGSAFNRNFIKQLQFRGEAKHKSRFLKDSILLDNAKKYGWADLALTLKCPLDLSGRRLSCVLKGKRGGEKIGIVLRDSNNKSVRFTDIYLSSNWQPVNIPIKNAGKDIDLKNINHMRIESGYAGESASQIDSPIDVSIYIKDLKLTKEPLT